MIIEAMTITRRRFARLKAAGFNGPIMVEGVAVGATRDETTANARENCVFLEKLIR